MKKLFLILILALVFYSCVESDTCSPGTGEVPENNISDLGSGQIPLTATGGDPRGTYFANEPLLTVISTDTTKNVIDSVVKSSGNLMYEFTGSTDTEGNFTLIEDFFDIEAYLIWKNEYGQTDVSFIQNVNNDPPSKITGKWSVEEKILIMESCNQKSAVNFTANSKGLFFIKDYIDVTVGRYKTVMAYKRQN